MTIRAGFIGLGNIGLPMAKRLAAAGLATTVFDVVTARVAELEAAGARGAATPGAVAAASDVVGVCVRDDADVRAVFAGDAGILAGARRGTIVAIHSTVQPATVEALAAEASPLGVAVVDACITGGAAGAAQGTLTVMAGGDADAIDRARPFFDCFAKKTVHTGAIGSGCKTKLCNNLMTYLAWTSIYEATLLARAAGLSQEVLEEVTGSNGNLTEPMRLFIALHKLPDAVRTGPEMQARMRGFVEIAEKDLAATLALARECGITLPGTATASQIMARVYALEDPKRR
ncbi:MAG: NAD(P)-dependent oxidoreductase [Myxococcota bacterium]|jgi:3-hydroxyisobutyrate dehydrogenase-like beta-hydroxyacid dehydrogenase|nr:NAD(P)-dependent oxidoreductase [Myxococcota bacterium]